jgi:queuine tRNA-ribosyltransferase
MSQLPFTLEKEARGTKARATTFRTLHGTVRTPVFMPVGTQATVKTLTVDNLKALGAQVLLANTYHLLLRPGAEVFRKFGGIHRFMNWDGPVLTDSGGFQIFSLPHSRSMREEGASFTSYVDGQSHLLSPESSIGMQRDIGSDIMMVLDQCIPALADFATAEAAMHLTHRWAERSLRARGDSPQALFGIVQGACHRELRKRSADHLSRMPFDGLAIGGLAVGETIAQRQEFTEHVTDYLPSDRPRYLMGVGTPIDLLEAVNSGVDMFDCIIPSQFAQRGVAFTSHGKIQLRRTVHKLSEAPLDAACDCPCCRHYSRAYLHHLHKSEETLGWHLVSLHNLSFYQRLMGEMREHILRDDFPSYYERQRSALVASDEHHPSVPERRRKSAARRLPALGDYEVVDSALGHSSIRQRSSGETMHSVSKPSEEAERLYIGQSALADRLAPPREGQEANELVIWDVGLGAASNAMAVLACFEESFATHAGAVRPVRLLSFERDLDPLRLAAREPARFAHLRHPAPHHLLAKGAWSHASGLFCWQLCEGDFAQLFEGAPAPDLILYDPFSPKVDSPLWTSAFFARLLAHCQPKPAELYTYSSSTAVRVALLRAGFFVAAGLGTGPKADTTVAFTRAESASRHPHSPSLLGAAWLARWRRSQAKFPESLPVDEQPVFAAQVEGHPQFSLQG